MTEFEGRWRVARASGTALLVVLLTACNKHPETRDMEQGNKTTSFECGRAGALLGSVGHGVAVKPAPVGS